MTASLSLLCISGGRCTEKLLGYTRDIHRPRVAQLLPQGSITCHRPKHSHVTLNDIIPYRCTVQTPLLLGNGLFTHCDTRLLPRLHVFTPYRPYLTRPQQEHLISPFIAGSTSSTYLNSPFHFYSPFLLPGFILHFNRVTTLYLNIHSVKIHATHWVGPFFQVGLVFRASPVGPNIALPSRVLHFPSFHLKISFPFPPALESRYIACKNLLYQSSR